MGRLGGKGPGGAHKDVANDRRRTRLAKVLKDFGDRLQYSVFECHLDEPALDRLRRRAMATIDEAEDSLRLYRLCAACQDRRELHGRGVLTRDPEVWIL